MSVLLSHSSIEFKKNEINTLGYIATRGFFDNDFSELASAISSTYDKYRGALASKKSTIDFRFVADFEIEIEKKTHRIVLHAEVTGNYGLTTYSLGVCGNKTRELIRRFHFDYVHTNGGSKQKVPASHLQYGGKSGPGFGGKLFDTNNIEHWLSEPRLCFPPINTALLLDIVLNEFASEKTKQVTNKPEWRTLVRKNETFVYKDYYRAISSLIDTERHKTDLVRDICYL